MGERNMPESSTSGDRDLIQRFRAGDREALTVIYRVHSPAVYRFALHMTGDRMKAADVAQDVFVWLIHHPGDYDPARGELNAFLIGVTRKFLLRQHRIERKWIPFSEAADAFEMQSGNPAADGARDSDAAALREAIAALPLRYREVVVLCDLEEKTYEAAAVALECAVGTVRSRLHRARELLGRKLHAKRELQRFSV
jgi:RNA polymerase sigma-70 factor, ECF subfamily